MIMTRDIDPNSDTVPLSSCDRGICENVRSVGISDISSMAELILARTSTFSFPRKNSTWTVCLAHRSSLGIGWLRGENRCQVPAGLVKHTNKRKSQDFNHPDDLFQLIKAKGRLIVVLAKPNPRKFSVTQGSLFL